MADPTAALVLPADFPGAWQNLPTEVRRYLLACLLGKSLQIHGTAGLLKWIYAGTVRPDGERCKFTTDGAAFWPCVVEDVPRWIAAGSPVPHVVPPSTPSSE